MSKLKSCETCGGAGRKRTPCSACYGTGFDVSIEHHEYCRICNRETRSHIEKGAIGRLYCGGCRVARKGYYL